MFDLGTDSGEKIEALRHLLGSPAWTGFYEPFLRASREYALMQLALPSYQRSQADPDNLLRAKIQVLDAMLNVGPAEIEAHDQNQRVQATEAEMDEAYARRAADGLFTQTGPTP